jgi:hypothetical protein
MAGAIRRVDLLRERFDGLGLRDIGRQPTMTIMALAFRAGERIANLARRGEI